MIIQTFSGQLLICSVVEAVQVKHAPLGLTSEVELPVPAGVEVLRGTEHQVRRELHHRECLWSKICVKIMKLLC